MTPQQQHEVLVKASESIVALGQLLQHLAEEAEAAQEAAASVGREVRWISADQAAAICGQGITRKQVYRWAKGKRWAARPSSRRLMVDEVGFRKWLVARAGPAAWPAGEKRSA